MAIYRVHKNKNYTTINNYLIRDENLNLKDKGMMVVLLSLPDGWDFSVAGLETICKEARNTINSILNNLQEHGYLERTKVYEKGKIKDWKYDIYEIPKNLYRKNEDIENEDIENEDIKNDTQLNTNRLNTKELNTKNKKKIIKEKYGTYGRVKLTIDEYLRLVNEFGEDFIKERIDLLDEYIEINNNKNKYTNFNLVLRRAIREKWFENKLKGGSSSFTETMKKLYDEQTNNS